MTISFTKSANTIWRDYNTDGVPASGKFSPIKGDLRTWGTEVENYLKGTTALDNLNVTGGAMAGVAITGGTISALTTDLAVADGGTGASNADSALTNLGAGAAGKLILATINRLAAKLQVDGYTTTALSGGTDTLTVNSVPRQIYTGTGGTVVLPVVSTLTIGFEFVIHNFTSGTLTVNSSGGDLVKSVPSGASIAVICKAITGTDASSWDPTYIAFNGKTGVGKVVLEAAATMSTLILTGQTTVDAGSVGSPTIAFSGDLNTGLYSPAADRVALVTAGAARFEAGASGQLGIGGANYGNSGDVLISGGSGAAPAWGYLNAAPGAQFHYEIAYASAAAYPTAGVTALGLNVTKKSGLGVTLASNQLTFANAGTYYVEASAAYNNGSGTGRNAAIRLRNTTAGTTLITGTGFNMQNATCGRMELAGEFTVAANDVIELQGQANGTGVDQAVNQALLTPNVNHIVKIWRIA